MRQRQHLREVRHAHSLRERAHQGCRPGQKQSASCFGRLVAQRLPQRRRPPPRRRTFARPRSSWQRTLHNTPLDENDENVLFASISSFPGQIAIANLIQSLRPSPAAPATELRSTALPESAATATWSCPPWRCAGTPKQKHRLIPKTHGTKKPKQLGTDKATFETLLTRDAISPLSLEQGKRVHP